MNTVLEGLIGHICLAYLDDVIVFSKNPQNHLKDLEQVFKRISDSGLKMKPRKCKFFRDEVLYLGHKVSKDGVQPDPEKIKAVLDWPLPTDLKELQSFL